MQSFKTRDVIIKSKFGWNGSYFARISLDPELSIKTDSCILDDCPCNLWCDFYVRIESIIVLAKKRITECTTI